jgi:hypothetical protein
MMGFASLYPSYAAFHSLTVTLKDGGATSAFAATQHNPLRSNGVISAGDKAV